MIYRYFLLTSTNLQILPLVNFISETAHESRMTKIKVIIEVLNIYSISKKEGTGNDTFGQLDQSLGRKMQFMLGSPEVVESNCVNTKNIHKLKLSKSCKLINPNLYFQSDQEFSILSLIFFVILAISFLDKKQELRSYFNGYDFIMYVLFSPSKIDFTI